jgi:hypothetical protein
MKFIKTWDLVLYRSELKNRHLGCVKANPEALTQPKYHFLNSLRYNYNKKCLKKLIKEICSGTVNRLVLTHKDRLLRFGSELVFSLCEHFETEVVIINASLEANFEDDLVQVVWIKFRTAKTAMSLYLYP